MAQRFSSFKEFYPYYLAEHQNRLCRRCHFVGSWLGLICICLGIAVHPAWLPGALLSGYGSAWIGHFVFEKNRPATFQHPFYSFVGDWVMFGDILRGKLTA